MARSLRRPAKLSEKHRLSRSDLSTWDAVPSRALFEVRKDRRLALPERLGCLIDGEEHQRQPIPMITPTRIA
jgi:hypothetical protein